VRSGAPGKRDRAAGGSEIAPDVALGQLRHPCGRLYARPHNRDVTPLRSGYARVARRRAPRLAARAERDRNR
jgi:hypothetical protein